MEQTSLARIHNSLYWPDLTTYGPKMTREMYPRKGNSPLGCSISVKADADRDPAYLYWIVKEIENNSNAVNILEPGDWITSINGSSTMSNDTSFLEKLKNCRSVLSVTIRKPLEQQEFYLWDPNQVAIDIKVRVKRLPFSAAFSLNIFYPDFQDSKKTYALVNNIKLPDFNHKKLKHGDIVISINERKLENETYEGLQKIVHQLNLQKQIKVTVQQRQWRQNDHLTSLAIDSPAILDWRPLQAELQKKSSKEPLGFKFVFAKNQLEQPCPIIKQIAAGETPAAKCPYLSPGCKITAVNRQPVKGLSFEEMKTMLQKAQITVVLSIEEPLGLLQEKNSPSPKERYTWPVEEEKGILTTSQSEAHISFSNSSLADGVQSVDLCEEVQGASSTLNDAKFNASPDQERPVNCSTQQMPSDSQNGYNEVNSLPLAPTVEVPSKAQDISICCKCMKISKTDKQEQIVHNIPGKIYFTMCQSLDKESPFFNDYRIFGEHLGFSRGEINLLNNQPTDSLLRVWSEREGTNATVERIINILDDMQRHDILQILQNWVESKSCSKCSKALQKAHEKESDV